MSIWISLPIEREELEAVKDPEYKDNLHMTLAFLKDSEKFIFSEEERDLTAFCAGLASGLRPVMIAIDIKPKVFDKGAVVLPVVYSLQLETLKRKLDYFLESLEFEVDRTYNYSPHITVRYDGDINAITLKGQRIHMTQGDTLFHDCKKLHLQIGDNAWYWDLT